MKLSNEFLKKIDSPYILSDTTGHVGNHAMIVVGYAKNSKGDEFFLARNSWGEKWAMNGYIWLTKTYLDNKTITNLNIK